ncbi:thioredoxin-dependent thiol peroxidase [Halobellus sp. Atlit-31R]|nr:thioredoxin-dependent thiol peroxidase [Halobellus sp. Atlit-31R]
MLDTGEPAPDFELPDQHGERTSLSDHRGEYVVVYFYPRADTPGCTTEACGFRDNFEAFEAREVPVFGISDDPVDDLASFATKYDLPFRLLSDPDGDVAGAFDSYGEKNMFGNTFDGVFRNTYVVGPDGDVVLAYEGVSPEGHADAILDDLSELDAA